MNRTQIVAWRDNKRIKFVENVPGSHSSIDYSHKVFPCKSVADKLQQPFFSPSIASIAKREDEIGKLMYVSKACRKQLLAIIESTT